MILQLRQFLFTPQLVIPVVDVCSGDEKDVMRERADVAHRRAELSRTCEVLAKALTQLQQIPRELETTAGTSTSLWLSTTSPRRPKDMTLISRPSMDVYTGIR
jgi:hypothetical protein